MEIAILACGCFWGPEIKFSKLKGVSKTEVGYCGGNSENVSYEEVCRGNTNHAEVVKVEFDKNLISYDQILEFFFKIHDPTTLNRQGLDLGTQYRSEIFFCNNDQKEKAVKILNKYDEKYKGKVVTKISEVKNYTRAENYHQKYLEKKF